MVVVVAIQLDDGEAFPALATKISERLIVVRTERLLATDERVLIIFANPLAYEDDIPKKQIPVMGAMATADISGAVVGDPLPWQRFRVFGWQ